jgi:hypothetical protein
MGAGEQRVFEIIERVYTAPKNSLILIDEVDLLMHEDSFRRLIVVLKERAENRSLQIVFTTHRESVLERDDLAIHHLFQANGRTLTIPSAHPDVWQRLTGDQIRSLEVFVEDDLAKTIVSKIAADLGIRKHVEIVVAGAAANLFTLAGGLALRGEDLTNKLVVLDGDVYRTNEQRIAQVNKVVTGHGQVVEGLRSRMMESISMLCLPELISPEQYLHNLLLSVDAEQARELGVVAQEIDVPLDRHGYVNAIVERIGEGRDVGLRQIIDCAALAEGWQVYTRIISDWLVTRCAELSIDFSRDLSLPVVTSASSLPIELPADLSLPLLI